MSGFSTRPVLYVHTLPYVHNMVHRYRAKYLQKDRNEIRGRTNQQAVEPNGIGLAKEHMNETMMQKGDEDKLTHEHQTTTNH